MFRISKLSPVQLWITTAAMILMTAYSADAGTWTSGGNGGAPSGRSGASRLKMQFDDYTPPNYPPPSRTGSQSTR